MIVFVRRLASCAWFLRRSAVLLIPLLALEPVCAAQSTAPLPVAVRTALRSAGIPAESVGAYVREIGAPAPVLGYNAARPMNPASTIKLVTTLAALELLGPSYTWKTEVYINGPLKGDTLDGDLIVRGTGDPKLTLENFWLMLRALRARGLREIRGDLVLDRSYFAPAGHDPSRFDNEPARPYNVGPDALLVNYKSIRFHFVPDLERRTVQVIPEPPLAQVQLKASVALSDDACGDWRARVKGEFQSNDASARANFSGTYPAACGENTWNVAMLSHASYVWGLFRQLWEEMGGSFKGGVRDGSPASNDRLFYTAESPPLAEVVRDMNKFSNNVMARQVFLSLSAEMLKLPASTERSVQVIESWLAQKGLRTPNLVLENGSGLSRNERISAAVMGEMLASAWKSPVMAELVASLPLVAYDGTMRKRLRQENVAGQAHIKTGSLSGVRSLAGYVLDRDARRYVVVFFINHPNAVAAEPAQDALLRWVYEDAPPKQRGAGTRDSAAPQGQGFSAIQREPAADDTGEEP